MLDGNTFGNIRVANQVSAVHEVAAISRAIVLIERACQAFAALGLKAAPEVEIVGQGGGSHLLDANETSWAFSRWTT